MNKADLLARSHQQAHDAEHDPENTLFVQLTRREMWHLLYGMLCASSVSPCLESNGADLLEKFADLMTVQEFGRGKETP